MGIYPIAVCKYFAECVAEVEEVKVGISNIINDYPSIRLSSSESKLSDEFDLNINCLVYDNSCYVELKIFGECSSQLNEKQTELCKLFCEKLFEKKLCHAFSFLSLVEEKKWFGKKPKLIEKFLLMGSPDASKLFLCELKRLVDMTEIQFSKKIFNFDGLPGKYGIENFDELISQINDDERFKDLIRRFPFTPKVAKII